MAPREDERRHLIGLLVSDPEPPVLRLRRQATEILRGLISAVQMVPDVTAPGEHHIELVGDLAVFFGFGRGPNDYARTGSGL